MAETPASPVGRIREWCSAEGLLVAGDPQSGPAVVSVLVDNGRVDVEIGFTATKAVLRHELAVPLDAMSLDFAGSQGVELPTGDDVVRRIIAARWGLITGTVRREATQLHITLECGCYLEDLTRTPFFNALNELVRTRQVLDATMNEIAAQRYALRSLSPPGQAAAPALPSGPPWHPTHAAGSRTLAWLQPDGSGPPAAQLDPGLEVMVTETRGGWAHIMCSNSWTAWVDQRQLQPLPR